MNAASFALSCIAAQVSARAVLRTSERVFDKGTYTKESFLGRGGYGEVHRGELSSGRPTQDRPTRVVLKTNQFSDKRAQELNVLKHMADHSHENVMRFYGMQGEDFVLERSYVGLFAGRLPSYPWKAKVFDLSNAPEVARSFTSDRASEYFDDLFQQMIAGVDHFHDHGFVHGDIKSDNVLFFNQEKTLVKLVDFGEAKGRCELGVDFDWYRLFKDIMPCIRICYDMYATWLRQKDHDEPQIFHNGFSYWERFKASENSYWERFKAEKDRPSFSGWYAANQKMQQIVSERFSSMFDVAVIEDSRITIRDLEPFGEHLPESAGVVELFYSELTIVQRIADPSKQMVKLMQAVRNFYIRTYPKQSDGTIDFSGDTEFSFNWFLGGWARGKFDMRGARRQTMLNILKRLIRSFRAMKGVLVRNKNDPFARDIEFVRHLKWIPKKPGKPVPGYADDDTEEEEEEHGSGFPAPTPLSAAPAVLRTSERVFDDGTYTVTDVLDDYGMVRLGKFNSGGSSVPQLRDDPLHVVLKSMSERHDDGLKREQELKVLKHMADKPHKNVMRFYGIHCYDFVLERAFVQERFCPAKIFDVWDVSCAAIEREEEDDDVLKRINYLKDLFKQMIAGVDHFHEQEFFHGDIKSQNVLFFDRERTQLKLINFGQARTRSEAGDNFDWYRLAKDIWPCIRIYYDSLIRADLVSNFYRSRFAQWYAVDRGLRDIVLDRFWSIFDVAVMDGLPEDLNECFQPFSKDLTESAGVVELFYSELSIVKGIERPSQQMVKLMQAVRNFYIRTYPKKSNGKFDLFGHGKYSFSFFLEGRAREFLKGWSKNSAEGYSIPCTFTNGQTMLDVLKQLIPSLRVGDLPDTFQYASGVIAKNKDDPFADNIEFVRELEWVPPKLPWAPKLDANGFCRVRSAAPTTLASQMSTNENTAENSTGTGAGAIALREQRKAVQYRPRRQHLMAMGAVGLAIAVSAFVRGQFVRGQPLAAFSR